MRNSFLTPIYFFLIVTMISCGETKKETSQQTTQAPAPEVEVPEEQTRTFEDKYQYRIKEELFFFLRKYAVNADEYTFFKTESITLDDNEFVYKTIIIDKENLHHVEQLEQEKKLAAGMFSITEVGNRYEKEIEIKGTLKPISEMNSGNEKELVSMTLTIKAEYVTSFYQNSPYGYNEGSNYSDGFDYEGEMIVNFKEPRIYNRDVFHLKARIKELNADDLSGYDSEELAYLRNEIFARHGHTFKTDKMKDYFLDQAWYVEVYEDATSLLNEIEKQNALFIKSLES